jgi:hypothetical protein
MTTAPRGSKSGRSAASIASLAKLARRGSRLVAAYFVVARGRTACPLSPPQARWRAIRIFSGSVGRRAEQTGARMIDALAYAVIALAGVAAIWGLVSAIANKPPGKAQLLYAAGLEVMTVIQSIIAAAKMIGGFRPAELATTIGYLIGIVILIPIAWLWANVERTRFSGIVLAVAAFAVLAMTLRLLVLWTPAG